MAATAGPSARWCAAHRLPAETRLHRRRHLPNANWCKPRELPPIGVVQPRLPTHGPLHGWPAAWLLRPPSVDLVFFPPKLSCLAKPAGCMAGTAWCRWRRPAHHFAAARSTPAEAAAEEGEAAARAPVLCTAIQGLTLAQSRVVSSRRQHGNEAP